VHLAQNPSIQAFKTLVFRPKTLVFKPSTVRSDMAVKFWKDDGSLGSTGAKYVEECSLKGYHTRPVYGADWCKEKDMVGARYYHWGG